MAAFKCFLSLCLMMVVVPATAVDVVPATAAIELDGAVLLQAEGQRLGELSKQVAETNRALEELLATKLRDIHYATVIGELRAEIDALR